MNPETLTADELLGALKRGPVQAIGSLIYDTEMHLLTVNRRLHTLIGDLRQSGRRIERLDAGGSPKWGLIEEAANTATCSRLSPKQLRFLEHIATRPLYAVGSLPVVCIGNMPEEIWFTFRSERQAYGWVRKLVDRGFVAIEQDCFARITESGVKVAYEKHIAGCDVCSGPLDGCEVGQLIEELVIKL